VELRTAPIPVDSFDVDAFGLLSGPALAGYLSRSSPEGEGRFLHAVVREEDGKELPRLRTAWVPRWPRRRRCQAAPVQPSCRHRR